MNLAEFYRGACVDLSLSLSENLLSSGIAHSTPSFANRSALSILAMPLRVDCEKFELGCVRKCISSWISPGMSVCRVSAGIGETVKCVPSLFL